MFMKALKIDSCEVKGFNYHPSYSTTSLVDWLLFDEEVWRRELTNGKEKFPKMNTVRLWLSWNAYCQMQNRFIENVRKAIDICRDLGLYVIPCVFNRWHDPMVDCDGIYIDHFLPGSSWILKYGDPFSDYIDALCASFGDEEQILVWDICNEPFAYNSDFPLREIVMKHELEWLQRIAYRMRANNVSQPLGIGSINWETTKNVNDICDVYLTHMYYVGGEISRFEGKVECAVAESKKNGKPLIVSECCWGSADDKKRAELIRVTLSAFKKYGVGFVAHALQYCGVADLHQPEDGRYSPDVGNLCFINKDGSVRPYHDIFNEF